MASGKKDINFLLQLLDEWIAGLDDSDVREECRKSGRDFFDFMTSRGVHPGWCVKLVRDVYGFHPRELWRKGDLVNLRQAIFSYDATEIVARGNESDEKSSGDRRRNAQRSANQAFRGEDRI